MESCVRAIRLTRLALAVMACGWLLHGDIRPSLHAADGWWNTGWGHRRAIAIDASAATAALTDFPVLVVLTPGTFDYAQAQADGADVRLVDANGTALSFEIERWVPGGTSRLWVRVPVLSPGANTIYLYYSNPAATSGASPASVWDNQFAAVWHLADATGANPIDSTANQRTLTQHGSPTQGAPAGLGLAFDGNGQYLDVAGLDIETVTVEAFATSPGTPGYLLEHWNSNFSPDHYPYQLAWNHGYPQMAAYAFPANPSSPWGGVNLNGTAWHHVAGTRIKGSTLRVFVDGVGGQTVFDTTGRATTNGLRLGIGARPGANPHAFFSGSIAEVRVSTMARSPNWIRMTALTLNGITAVGAEETAPPPAPASVTMTLNTNVPGLSLAYDGQGVTGPFTTTALAGSVHAIEAPSPQTVDGHLYEFVAWSDLGPATHSTTTPDANATYVATYRDVASAPGTYAYSAVMIPGALETTITGMNTSGQAVGRYRDATGALHPFLSTDGVLTELQLWPAAINNTGHIVGTQFDGHAVIYDGGSFVNIDVPGATVTEPRGLNDKGDVVGTYTDAAGIQHYAVWNGVRSLVEVPGATFVEVHGINNLGQVAGTCGGGPCSVQLPGGTTPAQSGFVFTDGIFARVNVGCSTTVTGINNAGHVVGSWCRGTSLSGFIRVGGDFVDIDPYNGSQCSFIEPAGVTDGDHVFGTFMNTGACGGTLTFPVSGTFLAIPAPVSVTLATNFAGLALGADGHDAVAPVTLRWSVGSSHTVAAPVTQTADGRAYRFVGWSDNGDATHKVTAPAAAATLTATYRDVTLPPPDYPWWDNAWTYRKAISVNAGAITTTLNNFPVLVVLDPANFDYAKAQSKGGDLRFVDAKQSLLPYEIEEWTPGGATRVWVKVPTLAPGPNTIWLYYGNPDAFSVTLFVPVWDEGFSAVWHLTPFHAGVTDSTGNNNTLTPHSAPGPQAPAPGGVGRSFDGVSQYFDASGVTLDLETSTVEAFATSPGTTGYLVEHWDSTFTPARYPYQLAWNEGRPRVAVYDAPFNPGTNWNGTSINGPSWHHVAGTRSKGDKLAIFLDGAAGPTVPDSTTRSTMNGSRIAIGARPGASPHGFFKGAIAEVRISKVVRSADWIRMTARTLAGGINTFGAENGVPPPEPPSPSVTLTLRANIPGVTVTFDGQDVVTPVSAVIGSTHTIAAPSPQLFAGKLYEFVAWSDLGFQSHSLTTPASSATIVATYRDVASLPGSYSYAAVMVPGAIETTIAGMNAGGQIVGSYRDATGISHAFLSTNGVLTELPFTPADINNAGQILGYDTGGHAVIYSGGGFTNIDVPGALSTKPVDLNDFGDVVGAYTDLNGSHQYMVRNGVPSLITVPGATMLLVNGINNAGQVVGTCAGGPCNVLLPGGGTAPQSGFVITSGVFAPVNFGCFTQATDINNAGHVVGSWCRGSSLGGFIRVGTTFVDIDPYGGNQCSFIRPSGVSDGDHVFGTFLNTGACGTFTSFPNSGTFLAIPKPAPAP